MKEFSLNLRGRLREFGRPAVMGIINVTPDSFYENSRAQDDEILLQAEKMISEGASIIDIGGCSTRPGFSAPPEDEEICRVVDAVKRVRETDSEIIISVDTFRSGVAQKAIEAGADMVNDVSGMADKSMADLVKEMKTPYVLTDNGLDESVKGIDVVATVVKSLQAKVRQLTLMGVNDIIIDPGFGFGKNIEQNYMLLQHLDELQAVGCPVLVGVSRKSMICKTLSVEPSDALNGTTSLNTIAILKGASILRVHDVKEAVEVVELTEKLESK